MYVLWTSADLADLDPARDLPGPWVEVRVASDHLAFVDSDDTLSRVYHALKWALPEGAALTVAPLAGLPKAKGLRPGTTSWLRDRLSATALEP
ncbi:hypothetical protein [Nocardioides lianchengensis]|uniref:Uncharacterized protein n=1 Tax=Nocardioides lianchengensis TaxID=1045774 RepID=A0A1G6ZFD3_9ACTN|nr:hypothetical protein [Nocardioides lianchengensis]NYG11427.1 hypothetical protein [Nocardioides lianchengensis]SDE00565.1 hypothetical protein SAMN05421872_11399 [Nocardioides lianchengensis]